MRFLAPLLCSSVVFVLWASPAQALEVRAKEGDSGRTLRLQRGDVLRLTLKENPSTGFGWRTVKNPSRRVLRRTFNRFIARPETNPPTAGAPGERVIVWRVRGHGRTSLKIALFPPGTGTKAAKTVRLTIVSSSPSARGARHRGRSCNQVHSHTIAQNQLVRVYTRNSGGNPVLYACRRSSGRRVELDRTSDDGLYTSSSFDSVKPTALT